MEGIRLIKTVLLMLFLSFHFSSSCFVLFLFIIILFIYLSLFKIFNKETIQIFWSKWHWEQLMWAKGKPQFLTTLHHHIFFPFTSHYGFCSFFCAMYNKTLVIACVVYPILRSLQYLTELIIVLLENRLSKFTVL